MAVIFDFTIKYVVKEEDTENVRTTQLINFFLTVCLHSEESREGGVHN